MKRNHKPLLPVLKISLQARVPEVVEALLGRPTTRDGRTWRYGRKGSLAIATNGERAGLWHDFERGEGGDLIDLIRREMACDFPAALAWAASFLGIDGAPTRPGNIKIRREVAHDRPATVAAVSNDDAARTQAAMAIWRDGVPINGTLAETYLRQARGIDGPNYLWPADLRFHRRLHLVGDRPALIGLVRDVRTGTPKAIQATALKPDGSDRERDEGGRMSKGPTTGGAIMLTTFDEVTLGLGLAEGLETALSVLDYGWRPVWTTIGTAGLKNFPVLAGIEALTIWADNDAGNDRNAGLEAAKTCGIRWRDAGIEVAISFPRRGGDWNDAIKARAVG